LGPGRPGRLLWVIHHLAVDAVSWRILLEDLAASYAQLSRGLPAGLPRKTTSFKEWSERLTAHATSPELLRELPYWRDQAWALVQPLPLDLPGGANTVAEERTLSVHLAAEETEALLQEVPPVYKTRINDALLAAVARAFERWTGNPLLPVDIEGHGREEGLFEVDLTRTVGWFTSLFPVLLDLRRCPDPGSALKAVKEQLRAVPASGVGYGMLRYLTPAGEELARLPAPEISFNYLGQLDQTLSAEAGLRLAEEPAGAPRSPRAGRHHRFDLSASVLSGQLLLSCTYSAGLHLEPTVRGLLQSIAAELRELVAHCRAPEAGGFTPSDFAAARLNQQQLDRFLSRIGKVPGDRR
ncbi:MAG: condensation domain-containing protein, partial [Acidobacteriota bacterium]|nr:condensation domain-containing protein [Acidobacteriota bacterium]